jgi:putative transposase
MDSPGIVDLMPRKARIDMPGLLQHVIVRGIEKRKIFLDDNDRRMFVDRLSALLAETGTDCFAWAMLGNHFHLLLRCNRTRLSVFMKRLLTGYAINFNHKHGRSGHLFQNRYKSIVCEEDAYLLELIRYIHLNPLRAKAVPDLESLDGYPWSGHGVLMGRRELPCQTVDEVLLLFGKRLSDSRRKYRQFVAEGVARGRRPEMVGGGLRRSRKAGGEKEDFEMFDDRVLGSGEFVEALQQEAGIREILPPKWSLAEIQELVCDQFQVAPESILRRTRVALVSEVRAVFCYVAVRVAGKPGVDVGCFLAMGSSAVSRAVLRGERVIQGNPLIKAKLDKVLRQQIIPTTASLNQ